MTGQAAKNIAKLYLISYMLYATADFLAPIYFKLCITLALKAYINIGPNLISASRLIALFFNNSLRAVIHIMLASILRLSSRNTKEAKQEDLSAITKFISYIRENIILRHCRLIRNVGLSLHTSAKSLLLPPEETGQYDLMQLCLLLAIAVVLASKLLFILKVSLPIYSLLSVTSYLTLLPFMHIIPIISMCINMLLLPYRHATDYLVENNLSYLDSDQVARIHRLSTFGSVSVLDIIIDFYSMATLASTFILIPYQIYTQNRNKGSQSEITNKITSPKYFFAGSVFELFEHTRNIIFSNSHETESNKKGRIPAQSRRSAALCK